MTRNRENNDGEEEAMQTIESLERIKRAIAHEVSRCEYDAMGNDHAGVEVSVLPDLVIVRVLRGVPPPADQRLATTEQGRALLRQWHHTLFDHYRERLKDTVATLTASEVKDVYMDIGLGSGEKVIVFTLGSGR